MKYIKGIFKKAIYKNDKGYTVGLFKILETNDDSLKDMEKRTITITGYFYDLNEEDTYILYGSLVTHPKYGYQYEVKESEKVLPQDIDGIIEFLSSDLFKGIGKSMAKKIVKTLGSDTLKLILEDITCLYKVPKLSESKMKIIYDTLTRYTESHETIIYLTEIGFTMKDALSIYNTYKDTTVSTINMNIYNLIDSADITFNKVDLVAKNMNMDLLDQRRIKAVIMYIFTNLIYETGNTYLEYEDIYDNVCKFLNTELDLKEFDDYLSLLINERKLYNDDSKYYLYYMYEEQKNIVLKIKHLIKSKSNNYKNIDQNIKELEERFDITYSNKQMEAIKKSLEENLLIITGGPGTGKTTIIKAITLLYIMLNKIENKDIPNEIALLAPTGRASKRLSEATNLPSYTIHRYLKWNKETNSFGINEYNKNFHKFIIIDEVSMIDINLLDSLFKGINDNIKLVLVGDSNQLPSVGPGQILKDLIESDVVNKIELDLLYRQDENSYINVLANEIKENNLSDNYLLKHSDYNFLSCNKFNLKNNINALANMLKDKEYKNVQFMAPMYRGECGIDNINILLQSIFNPKSDDKKEYTYGDTLFRVGDKVLQLENDPDNNIFNGDIGYIKDIYFIDKKCIMDIDFDGNLVNYESKNFSKLKHGFIISIHKSQGSEFDNVVIIVSNSFKRMLYKKLIYTGITRTKKKLIIVGEEDAFIYSISNNNEIIRKTDLKNKMYKSIQNS